MENEFTKDEREAYRSTLEDLRGIDGAGEFQYENSIKNKTTLEIIKSTKDHYFSDRSIVGLGERIKERIAYFRNEFYQRKLNKKKTPKAMEAVKEIDEIRNGPRKCREDIINGMIKELDQEAANKGIELTYYSDDIPSRKLSTIQRRIESLKADLKKEQESKITPEAHDIIMKTHFEQGNLGKANVNYAKPTNEVINDEEERT